MSRAVIFAALAAATTVAAQGFNTNDPVLANKHIPWAQIPYKADTGNGDRGPQYGYNQCNSTTLNQNSLCQTSYLNDITDFCLWGPDKPNSAVGDTEGEMVAWCTQPTHGSRVIPAGAITGLQFMKTPHYIQVTGLINQAMINIAADDGGGELDPHGADLRGNPLGSLLYSNNLPITKTKPFAQVIEWHSFMGSNTFCFKACDPAGPNAAALCQHIYDRIGCQYNAPAAYQNGVFESCEGDDQDPPGIYTGPNGAVTTYQQPPESLGPISSMPYTARIPASSNCVTTQSAAIFTAAPSPTAAVTSSSAPVSSAAPTSAASSASGVAGTSKPATGTASTTKATGSATGSSNAAVRGSVDGVALASAAFMGIFAMIAGVAVL